MLTPDQISNFRLNGFVVVPGAISPEQVRALRSNLEAIFDHGPLLAGDSQSIRVDLFARYPELRWVLTEPGIVSSLRSLLGQDFVYFPETAAHDSSFGGWHKDTTTGEQAGEDFHRQPDFLMVQAAIYLQDNGPYGGGLDVIPGSHLYPDTYVRRYPLSRAAWRLQQWRLRAEITGRSLLRPVKRALFPPRRATAAAPAPLKSDSPRSDAHSIPSRAGDLVIFDVRLDHKASWPEKVPIPSGMRKLALFFVCSANNRHVDAYKQFLLRRAEYAYLKNHRYPPDLLQIAQAHSIHLG